MKLIILLTVAICMGSLSGCVPAYQGEEARFEVDTTQQYFYNNGPGVFPRTNFDSDYKGSFPAY